MDKEFDFKHLANLLSGSELVYGELNVDPGEAGEEFDVVCWKWGTGGKEYCDDGCYLDLVKTAERYGCKIESIDQYGGMEKGSDIWAIYEVTYPNSTKRLWKCFGYYASHYGADYIGCEEVKAQPIRTVEYVPVNQ